MTTKAASDASHIVILSPAYPLRGGIASSTERLAREWQGMGRKVTIYSFSYQYPGILFPGKTQYAEGDAPEGLHIESVIHSLNPLNWWRVGNRLARLRPDLIVVRYWLPFMAPALGTILRVARFRERLRTVALVDNLIPHERRPGDRLLTRYFCRAIDAFVVMSRKVADDIRKLLPGAPVEYVAHPIYDNYGLRADRQEALQRLGLPPASRYLLFFGFVRRYKGLDLLLRALADERLRQRDLNLLVAGEFYEDEAAYRALIEELELGDRVILHNEYIPNARVRHYFGAADLVVQPYRAATQSGISQLAYHFDRPMVVTRVGGLPEIVEHGRAGYVVDVDPTAIADAIEDFYTFDRHDAFVQGVRERKRLFSWTRLAQALEGVGQKPAS